MRIVSKTPSAVIDCRVAPLSAAELAPVAEARETDVVLIVDDAPENLAVVHDALDESGYTVLVATSGEAAIASAARNLPDIVLLDAMMPGMDGFDVCRKLKADAITEQIPVVFMTGLQETEHVVAAFAAGGTDYVVKPVRVNEVLARVASHLSNSRLMRQARNALDAFGQAVIAVTPDLHRLVWETPLARKLLDSYFPDSGRQLPPTLHKWLSAAGNAATQRNMLAPMVVMQDARRLTVTRFESSSESELMLLLREESDEAQVAALMLSFRLTQREAQVLYWLTKGKTNRDIGEILGTSPRTVNKHLEHVFVKLGVETRTAAAAMAMKHVRASR